MAILRASAPGRTADSTDSVTPGRTLDALLIGLVAFLLAVAGSWIPSIWYDEAATITSATRDWEDLARMLQTVDAVHAVYYAMLHVWFDLVGYTPFTLRLPSAVFTALAAAGVVLLVRQLSGGSPLARRFAVISGIVFLILPRVGWMGTEGRSYALSTTLAVLLTLVFVASCQRTTDGTTRGRLAIWWAAYAALVALGAVIFLYLVLLVAAHGATLLWTLLRLRADGEVHSRFLRVKGQMRSRFLRILRHWLAASAAAALAASPLALLVLAQSGQLSWIDPPSSDTVEEVLVNQFFEESVLLATVGWLLVVVGVVVLVRAGSWRTFRARPTPRDFPDPDTPSFVSITLPWLVVPLVGLIVASEVISPVYSPRYLTFATPAVAILMGAALTAISVRPILLLAVAALLALAAPEYVLARVPEAKASSSWAEVSALIAREREQEPADVAEAVIFGPVRQHPSATTRVIQYAYPNAFAGMIDVTLRTPASETGALWETRYRLTDRLDRLKDADVAWLVTSNKQDRRPAVTRTLLPLGFRLVDEWHLTGVNVLRYERTE